MNDYFIGKVENKICFHKKGIVFRRHRMNILVITINNIVLIFYNNLIILAKEQVSDNKLIVFVKEQASKRATEGASEQVSE